MPHSLGDPTMAAEAAPPDPTDLLQDLPLDSKVKAQDAPQVTKKPSKGGALPRAPIRPYELQEYMNPNMCYLSSGYPSSTYYFAGYDGLLNDGAEMPSPGHSRKFTTTCKSNYPLTTTSSLPLSRPFLSHSPTLSFPLPA